MGVQKNYTHRKEGLAYGIRPMIDLKGAQLNVIRKHSHHGHLIILILEYTRDRIPCFRIGLDLLDHPSSMPIARTVWEGGFRRTTISLLSTPVDTQAGTHYLHPLPPYAFIIMGDSSKEHRTQNIAQNCLITHFLCSM